MPPILACMKNASGKEALVPIMTSQYEQIAALEERHGIRFKEGDMRPRIDYFHDAVQALTSGEADIYSPHSRLSVEHLAYDLGQLRAIQSKPLGVGVIDPKRAAASRGELVSKDQAGSVSAGPDRQTRQDLVKLYKDYTVLFAALFAEVADMNFQTRSDDMDTAVEDIGLVEQVMQQLEAGIITQEQAQAAVGAIENDPLRAQMQKLLAQKLGAKEKHSVQEKLNAVEGQIGQDKARIEQAHLNFATGQLAVYEEAKETVKRLAAQGMNLAGKFVENAVSQSSGRGTGMGV